MRAPVRKAGTSWHSNWPRTREESFTEGQPFPAQTGVRRVARRVERGNMEELRAIAQNFTAQPKAILVATSAIRHPFC